ncbi:MAG: glutamine-hydrolyzing GMP synthase [Andreesenia angusta]|nr:glutamine-hydrolyzing GMP synthase [Andreesenia angusta]
MQEFVDKSIEEIKSQIGDGKAICALSGGVDSSVCAVLVNKAIGDRLTCIFVDHGLLRKGEKEEVIETFKNQFKIDLIVVDAEDRFLGKLKGVSDPEDKRKIIGEEFIRVFEEEAQKLEGYKFLVQGTIYPDITESGEEGKGLIKSHHNVGGLPEDIDFELVEPLRTLYKPEVRKVGELLGLPSNVVNRQPFPGPGLGVRCLGEVTKEKLDILREADYIYRDEVKKAGLDTEIWQYFAAIPDFSVTGVTDGVRTYSHTIFLRAVNSENAVTADAYPFKPEFLQKVSERICSEIKEVNRVLYDVTAKPPATIEFE